MLSYWPERSTKMTYVPTIIKKVLRSEGLLVAAIPFLSSLIAITYETGYLSFYDIPFEYAEVSFKTIVAATVALIPIVVMIWLYLAAMIGLKEKKHPAWSYISDFLKLALMPLILFAFILDLMTAIWIILGIFIITAASIAIPYYLSVSVRGAQKSSSIWEYAAGKDLKIDGNGENGKKDSLGSKLLAALITPLLLSGYVFGVIWNAGAYKAQHEVYRWVLEEDSSYIVVRNYGDTFIFKQYDPLTKKLLDKIYVKKIDGNQSLRLRKVKLDKLKKTGEPNIKTLEIPKGY